MAENIPAKRAPAGRPRRQEGDDLHRLNFAWLVRLRWVAITGQSAVIIAVYLLSDLDFAYPLLATILFAEVLSNLALIAWARTGRPRHEALGPLVLIADIAFFTALLALTGGADNPFALLYLVHVAFAALVLRPLWTWGVTLLCIVLFVGLDLLSWRPMVLPWSSTAGIWTLETQGRWVAFLVSAGVLAFFIGRVQTALIRREQELVRARDAQLRSEKLASLATLAAGAAHEFSTPLSTIALVASELERGLEREGAAEHFIEDTALIRDQVERCREILRQMSADAGESMGEFLRPVCIDELIDHTLEGCRDRRRVRVQVQTERTAALSVPATALGQALRGLVNNALEASSPETIVELSARFEEDAIVLEIRDQGTGMTPEILQRASEPFFTTKEAGQGMGLGVFLARTLVEKIDGSLELLSTVGEGTTARVRLPAAFVEPQPTDPPEPEPTGA